MSGSRKRRVGVVVVVITTAVACGSTYGGENAEDGAFGGRCFPNGTCRDDLQCAQGVCLRPGNNDPDATTTTLPPIVDASTEIDTGDGDNDGAPPQKDAGPNVDGGPVCTKKQIGESCTATSECCGVCGQEKKCRASCDAINQACDNMLSNTDCCLGLYCGNSYQCKPCITAGNDAALYVLTSNPNPHSCCSGTVSSNGKCAL